MSDGCKATTKAGSPCSAQLWRDGWCRWHHPSLEKERGAWRRQGGEGRSNVKRAAKRIPRTLIDVQAALFRALAAVEAGELEPAKAQAMSALARAVVAVHGAGELEERLRALEAEAPAEPSWRGSVR